MGRCTKGVGWRAEHHMFIKIHGIKPSFPENVSSSYPSISLDEIAFHREIRQKNKNSKICDWMGVNLNLLWTVGVWTIFFSTDF